MAIFYFKMQFFPLVWKFLLFLNVIFATSIAIYHLTFLGFNMAFRVYGLNMGFRVSHGTSLDAHGQV
jgi:hypothetical protein